MTWHDDKPRSFDSFTAADISAATSMVVDGIRRDSRLVDQEITPFASARDLMCGSPPARWRLLARWAWFRVLYRRVEREIANQVAFAQRLAVIGGRS